MGLKHLIRWMMKEQVRQIKEEEAIIKAILKAEESKDD